MIVQSFFIVAVGHLASSATQVVDSTKVIVVGAGVAGLSAAIEAADRGLDVTVVDASSLFGGHAVMSSGDITLVGTQEQAELDIKDSPEAFLRDLVTWGEDNDPYWGQRYARESHAEVYQWLRGMGVAFNLRDRKQPPGNSVVRLHATIGRGMGLVTPLFIRAARHRNIRFLWNMRVRQLLIEKGRVIGVVTRSERTGKSTDLRAQAVVLATGGFQSDLKRVLASWPSNMAVPKNILVGSGLNSLGEGLTLAEKAGGVVSGLDHQWNYVSGIPDPAHPDSQRGISMRMWSAIWVNAQGKRFVNERGSMYDAVAAVTRQTDAASWAIFDDVGKRDFFVAGTGWENFEKFESDVLNNPKLTVRGDTVEQLAEKLNLPAKSLVETVARYNELVRDMNDLDFKRFNRTTTRRPPRPIVKGPFYGIRTYPLSRKSMGGIVIDEGARVVRANGKPVDGLYAAGEVTGLARINGKRALEGTFLGTSIFTGRVAGTTLAADLGHRKQADSLPPPVFVAPEPQAKPERSVNACIGCHPLTAMVRAQRKGYWHFEAVHQRVLTNAWSCDKCHQELSMLPGTQHKLDRVAQTRNCPSCHQAAD